MPQVVEGVRASPECSEDAAGDGGAHQNVDVVKQRQRRTSTPAGNKKNIGDLVLSKGGRGR